MWSIEHIEWILTVFLGWGVTPYPHVHGQIALHIKSVDVLLKKRLSHPIQEDIYIFIIIMDDILYCIIDKVVFIPLTLTMVAVSIHIVLDRWKAFMLSQPVSVFFFYTRHFYVFIVEVHLHRTE